MDSILFNIMILFGGVAYLAYVIREIIIYSTETEDDGIMYTTSDDINKYETVATVLKYIAIGFMIAAGLVAFIAQLMGY